MQLFFISENVALFVVCFALFLVLGLHAKKVLPLCCYSSSFGGEARGYIEPDEVHLAKTVVSVD